MPNDRSASEALKRVLMDPNSSEVMRAEALFEFEGFTDLFRVLEPTSMADDELRLVAADGCICRAPQEQLPARD